MATLRRGHLEAGRQGARSMPTSRRPPADVMAHFLARAKGSAASTPRPPPKGATHQGADGVSWGFRAPPGCPPHL